MDPVRMLAELETGQSARIVRLPAGDAGMTRLREMGLLPGTKLVLIRRAPLGDPIEISIRGALLSLRKREAELIEIEPA
ncbi:MAG: ferrous iron transport protein A [Verrucomicrobiales bacterium]|nr:ferrous iron transport protein A [Verrucomicrobiales bacterium]